MSKCLHIFRRDYRLFDNTSLIEASLKYDKIIPIFIFTYTQIRDNSLKSDICVKFLVESLKDLNKQLGKHKSKLRIYYGDEYKIITNLLKSDNNIKCISFNRDYTKYSENRDKKIKKIAEKHNVKIISKDDCTLHPLGTIKTTTGKTFTKFTPFYNKCLSIPVNKPNKHKITNLLSSNSKVNGHTEYTAPLESMYDNNKIKDIIPPEKGGRTNGIKLLNNIKKGLWNNYDKSKDLLIYNTTHLSSYNKFGCVSIREVFYFIKQTLGKKSGLLRQIIWRDFYYNLSAANLKIYDGALSEKYDNIKWKKSKTKLNKWIESKTGYPIVDACMREIKNTGYMHNRGRLIVSNFLTRILHQDWRQGEYYFAKTLYDYDPAQNNFGWQVNAAVSGTESRPLSQTILNPWIQSKKYDPDGKYIKKWLPELSSVNPKHLHKWDLHFDKYNLEELNYIKPIVDYTKEKEINIKLYKKYTN
jgi:deoxyribodipyrimidine photo-lyase